MAKNNKTKFDPKYHRSFEKELLEKGNVTLAPRTVEVPEGCWMCGSNKAKLTKARLYPDWMLQAFVCADAAYATVHMDATGNVIDKRETPFKQLVCDQICQDCIHGWMNELDTAFKPVFLGDVNAVLEKEPLLVARWIAKTATLINISQQRRIQVPAVARHGLSNKDGMPKGWRVYAFSCSSEGSSPIAWTQGAPIYGILPKEATAENKAQATLGNIFICSLKLSNFGAVAYWQPDGVYHLEAALPLRRLWPDPAGNLTEASWDPVVGMCVADPVNNKSRWLEELASARSSVTTATGANRFQ
jgi:hypothetical protein